ncbi:hypothetical protein [Mesorhizobium sp. AR10]|uniref:hypothetical protein n=1 Tax=Mesorhizobium sp. AR10 TaxID=2865839 RepID=UPI00215F1D46|nr:hypothetical protein [Mesorhizobium sp. AR10]
MKVSIVCKARRTPGIANEPWTCAVKQALSARICRNVDAVFMVVQPIALCLSVGRSSAAFGSWKSLIQGRIGSPDPDRPFKISEIVGKCADRTVKGDSGQTSCYAPPGPFSRAS